MNQPHDSAGAGELEAPNTTVRLRV